MIPKDKATGQLIPIWPNTEPLAITKITTSWDLTLNADTNFVEIINPNEECCGKYATWITDYSNSSFPVTVWRSDLELREDVTILSFAKVDWWTPTWIYVWEYRI